METPGSPLLLERSQGIEIASSPRLATRQQSEKTNSAVKVMPTLSHAKLSRIPSNDVILDSLQDLQGENKNLQKLNDALNMELQSIRKERDALQISMEQLTKENAELVNRVDGLIADIERLKNDLEKASAGLEQAKKEKHDSRERLVHENTKQIKQIENLRHELGEKDSTMKKKFAELELLRKRVEAGAHAPSHERKMELLYEVQELKQERNDLYIQRDELRRMNESLKVSIGSLESKLMDKDVELRNESRRHSVLTKEFNSLLEENNRIKTQGKPPRKPLIRGFTMSDIFASDRAKQGPFEAFTVVTDKSPSAARKHEVGFKKQQSRSSPQNPKEFRRHASSPSLFGNSEVKKTSDAFPNIRCNRTEISRSATRRP